MLAEEPSPDVIEDFLLDRSEVDEVFASGAELVRSARALTDQGCFSNVAYQMPFDGGIP